MTLTGHPKAKGYLKQGCETGSMVNYDVGATLKVPGQPDTFHTLGEAIKRFKALSPDKQAEACILVGVEARTGKTILRRQQIEQLGSDHSQ